MLLSLRCSSVYWTGNRWWRPHALHTLGSRCSVQISVAWHTESPWLWQHGHLVNLECSYAYNDTLPGWLLQKSSSDWMGKHRSRPSVVSHLGDTRLHTIWNSETQKAKSNNMKCLWHRCSRYLSGYPAHPGSCNLCWFVCISILELDGWFNHICWTFKRWASPSTLPQVSSVVYGQPKLCR